METWNRDQLYTEVWDMPLVKVAPKYGISAVALGKVCRKLKVPLPGRGYWLKKEFGKAVKRIHLPEAKDLPVVQRYKFPATEPVSELRSDPHKPEPTDPEYLRIVEIESRTIVVDPATRQHQIVKATERILKHAHSDEKGILEPRYDQPCLEMHVSKGALERALVFLNTVILSLESEGFPVSVQQGKHGTGAMIFGHRVPFAIVEKIKETGRREVKEYSWTKTKIDYAPTGILEFRVGDYVCGQKYRDRKKQSLESQLPKCIGELLRDGRSSIISAKLAVQRAIERQQRERERAELAQQIAEEEKKVQQLETWVANWARSQQMREFISALEKLWIEQGDDLSPDAQKAQRLIWMREQADRLDPLLPSSPSILDRKDEIRGW